MLHRQSSRLSTNENRHVVSTKVLESHFTPEIMDAMEEISQIDIKFRRQQI